MKEKIESKGYKVIAEIDRPILICNDKDHKDNWFIITESKQGQLVACNFQGNEGLVSRFIDLQDDLKHLDLHKMNEK